jgi:hypothetical protein
LGYTPERDGKGEEAEEERMMTKYGFPEFMAESMVISINIVIIIVIAFAVAGILITVTNRVLNKFFDYIFNEKRDGRTE